MIILDYNTKETVEELWQYDYGETLRIQGGNLQKAQEVHFSLNGTGGTTVTRIGVTKDGVTDVVIPDSMLENNDSEIDYLIYVFLYNRDSTSGETTKRFVLNVRSRPKPEHTGGTDGNAFGEVVEEVRKSAERAEAAETKAKEYETQTKADAAQTALDREKVKEMVDTVSNISEQVETVKNYAAQAQEASTNALLSEQETKKAEQSALQAQAGAETAEGMAEQHALEVAGNKAEVERMTTQVREDKTSVEQKVQNFNGTVAEQISTVRQTGIQETKKVTDEGEKQVKAVAEKGAEVLQSIPEDFQTQMQSKLDKQQGTENAGKLLGVGTDGNVALMGGAKIGEILIADYTHRGNPEFHFSEFDFATGIGTTTEPHGLTKKTEVLICPNDWTVLSPFKNMTAIPIEWTMIDSYLGLLPVDDTHLKVVKSTEETIINVNLEDVSNTNVDITKFHFEKPISYVIKNLDHKISTKYVKVLSSGYCFYTGRYRYRSVSVIFESGNIDTANYINTLGFSRYGNSPARNGIFVNEETLIDLRNNTKYYNKILSYARRKGYSHLVNDPSRAVDDVWIFSQRANVKAIKSYSTYSDDYAYMSNGTRIQIYALEGEYKNES